MRDFANTYDLYKAKERDFIKQAEQERLVAEASPIIRKPSPTMTKVGNLFIRVGTHLLGTIL